MRLKRSIVTLAATLIVAGCGGPGAEDGATSPTTTRAADLPGSSWSLAFFEEDADAAPPADGVELTVEFSAEGRIGGSDGCNRYNGSYEASDDGRLTVGALASTMMACADPVMPQAARFTGLLADATGFEIEDGQLLRVRTRSGISLLFLRSG